MKKYSLLEHTADIRLNVQASSREELFAGALEGMASIVVSDVPTSKQMHKEQITFSAIDEVSLLVDFLSEVLTAMHVNSVVYTEVVFDSLTENSLAATIKGHVVDKFDEDIKAVTYHEARIHRQDDGTLDAMIIFDI